MTNDILIYDEIDRPVDPFIRRVFPWSNKAHEWNVETRVGYTFGFGACDQFAWTPYLGVGYEGGRMAIQGFGRQKYWWFYVPVGFVLSYEFQGGFGIALDADFGMMADAHYVALDEPSILNYERKFGDRYRWELELPLTYTFQQCCDGYLSDGSMTIGLVPFWHGWRTRERLQGEQSVSFDSSSNGFRQTDTGVFLPGAVVENDPRLVRVAAGTEIELFTDMVNTFDQPVASPRMLNNSWGGRLEVSWNF